MYSKEQDRYVDIDTFTPGSKVKLEKDHIAPTVPFLFTMAQQGTAILTPMNTQVPIGSNGTTFKKEIEIVRDATQVIYWKLIPSTHQNYFGL